MATEDCITEILAGLPSFRKEQARLHSSLDLGRMYEVYPGSQGGRDQKVFGGDAGEAGLAREELYFDYCHSEGDTAGLMACYFGLLSMREDALYHWVWC